MVSWFLYGVVGGVAFEGGQGDAYCSFAEACVDDFVVVHEAPDVSF